MTDETKIVGDITSNTRGSGARYNYGKARVELIPLVYIADTFNTSNMPIEFQIVHSMLYFTGMFQNSGDPIFLEQALTTGKSYWTDCAKVFEYGAQKYAEYNWVKGMKWSVPIGCIGRHALKVLTKGETNDDESGLLHVGHIMCNLVMLKAFQAGYPEGDDLPPKYFRVAAEK